MSQSQRLRWQDVQAAYQLVGECRELGADAQAWMRHLNESMPRLVGGQLSLFMEMARPTRRPLILADTGWATSSDRDYMLRFLAFDNLNSALFKRLMDAGLARQGCVRRHQVLTDPDWYGCAIYADFTSPTRLDPFFLAARPAPDPDTFHYLFVQRPRGGRPFPRRAADLAWLCLRELARPGGAAGRGARPGPRAPVAAAAADPALSAGRGQRTSGGPAAGAEFGNGSPVREGAVPPLPRQQPGGAAQLFPPPLRLAAGCP